MLEALTLGRDRPQGMTIAAFVRADPLDKAPRDMTASEAFVTFGGV